MKMKTADKAAERKHGVGLGSEISQIIALDFASPIDHYVKDVRGIHGYGYTAAYLQITNTPARVC